MITRNAVFFFAVAVLFGTVSFAARYSLSAQESKKSKVTVLLEERREALKTRLEVIEKLVSVNKSTPEALIAAREDLLNAEIEMATNTSGRVAALEQKVENARRLEEVMQQRKHEAKATEAEVLLAKAARLGVEVELLREKDPTVKPE